MPYTVLHCLASMNRGGAETLIMNIFRHIDRSNYKFSFLLNSNENSYADEIKKYGGHIYIIPSRSSGFRQYCHALDTFFEEHKDDFDAIHMHTSSLSSLEPLYFAKKHGIRKRIIHSHNTYQDGFIHKVLHWFNKPFIKSLGTDFLSCSKVASDWLYKYTGVYNKSKVIRNGIDLTQFSYNEQYRAEIREQYGIASDDIVIGHVGRFDTVKNHRFLIEIFEMFSHIKPNAKLLCVGIGEKLEEIKKLVKERRINNVLFAGLQTEVYKFLSAFDYFVYPSLYEGLPVSLVEAQASGVITICSDMVSSEVVLSNYISQIGINRNASEWAQYISELKIIDRRIFVNQLEESGYDIIQSINYLTNYIYV